MSDQATRIKALKRRIRELAGLGLCQRDIARALFVSRHVVAYHAEISNISISKEARWETRKAKEISGISHANVAHVPRFRHNTTGREGACDADPALTEQRLKGPSE